MKRPAWVGSLYCTTQKQDPDPMQAIRFLHSALTQALPSVHSRRLKTLMCCVSALLRGRRLTLTGLGRFMPGKAYPKHAIKRVDRLLGNRHLQTERSLFYWVMLRALLGSLKHPLILVDWPPIDAAGGEKRGRIYFRKKGDGTKGDETPFPAGATHLSARQGSQWAHRLAWKIRSEPGNPRSHAGRHQRKCSGLGY